MAYFDAAGRCYSPSSAPLPSPPSPPVSPSSPASPASARPPVAEIKVEIRDVCGVSPPEHRTINLYPNKTVRVGRDPDNNEFYIENPTVSRNHLEFYSVIFEDSPAYIPMIYVRDRQSRHGSSVNGKPIDDGEAIAPARLLQNGDVVTIHPDVTFELVQAFTPKHNLNSFQAREFFADRYEVTDRLLGSGASARVYLAVDRKTGEQVVCKVYDIFNLDRAGKDGMIAHSMQETILRSQMDHPNIASFRGAYKSRNTLYVFEELATGGDLFSLLIRDRQFLESDVRWMVRQVTSAIAHMHERGIIHRDLKLENILCAVCPRPTHRLVVTDFGHAGRVGPQRLHGPVGTPGWQAPELIRPGRSHNSPVDMWSLGVLAMQLLAGASKIDTLDLFETFAKTSCEMKKPNHELDEIFDKICKIRSSSISDDARDFIRRCFHFNPQRRMTAVDALKHPWLCKPDEDLQLFLLQERETTAKWSRQEVFDKPFQDLPDLTSRRASGYPYFTPVDIKAGSHAVRRATEERKRKASRKDSRKSRGRSSTGKVFKMHDISMVPQFQSLKHRLTLKPKVSKREVQKQVLKSLAERREERASRPAEDQDEDGRADKRLKTEACA